MAVGEAIKVAGDEVIAPGIEGGGAPWAWAANMFHRQHGGAQEE